MFLFQRTCLFISCADPSLCGFLHFGLFLGSVLVGFTTEVSHLYPGLLKFGNSLNFNLYLVEIGLVSFYNFDFNLILDLILDLNFNIFIQIQIQIQID